MKELKILENEERMTLKEITDLLEVRHNDAMKTVGKMAEAPDFGQLRKIRSCVEVGNGGSKPIETCSLDKRQSMAVAARLNTSLLMRVIDRWQELENQTVQLPQTYKEALQELLVSVEKIEKLENQAAIDKPKAETYDNISNADDLTSWNVTAKVLGMGRNNMLKELREKKVLMDAAWKGSESHNVPYQKYIDQGYFQVKVKSYTEPETGTIYRSYTTFVTGKGLVWLEGLFEDQS